ncbi:DUF6446 family protein [Jannaschia ovalis]|uniref:DUF6446 family protein n=1 Tax=Jannaschia ovalis TaxID=3038773 RepID=A0ABY8LD65_9RHOB|nr:DUF6446 family protein [Jannaschia sp. GRR-S6-38]WGH79081.1 DUF6446 family protein [Jannaschia sp. GRR-S6-38]
MGKFAVILIVLSAFAAGAGLWYAQTRGYYDRVDGPVTLTLAGPEGGLTTLPATDVEAISSISSPLGFRACFQHQLALEALGREITVEPRPEAAPTIAPGWFDCYDAAYLGEMLATGEARAFTAYPNAAFGVDRIVALTADGRGWAWHELNDCGEKSYDGTVTGDTCPDRASFTPLIEGSL